MMRVRYEGKSFGVDGLTSGRVYEVLGINEVTGWLRVVDDSGEDYLYDPLKPRPAFASNEAYGRFEVVEDDEDGTLKRAIHG